MRKKRTILLTFMLFTTVFISLMTTNIIDVAATPMDSTIPQKDGNYWDFNQGEIIGWNVEFLEGNDHPPDSYLLMKIDSMQIFPNAIGDGNNYYGIILKEMKWQGSSLVERMDKQPQQV